MSWAAEEFATVNLGHERPNKRLNKRLVKVVQQWADKPSQCIPTAAAGLQNGWRPRTGGVFIR